MRYVHLIISLHFINNAHMACVMCCFIFSWFFFGPTSLRHASTELIRMRKCRERCEQKDLRKRRRRGGRARDRVTFYGVTFATGSLAESTQTTTAESSIKSGIRRRRTAASATAAAARPMIKTRSYLCVDRRPSADKRPGCQQKSRPLSAIDAASKTASSSVLPVIDTCVFFSPMQPFSYQQTTTKPSEDER